MYEHFIYVRLSEDGIILQQLMVRIRKLDCRAVSEDCPANDVRRCQGRCADAADLDLLSLQLLLGSHSRHMLQKLHEKTEAPCRRCAVGGD